MDSAAELTSPSDAEVRRRLEDALNEAENQLRAERERLEAAERHRDAVLDRSAALLADKDVALSQLKDRLSDVERQLADHVDQNTQTADQLQTCRANAANLEKDLQLERAKTSELEADVAHLRADLADVAELRGLETTNRLLREDLERVESRLAAFQLDNSRLSETCNASEETIRSLKLELELATSALRLKEGNVKNLEQTVETLGTEIGDLKNSLTHAENLACRTQTELVAANSVMQEERAKVERLQTQLSDETAKCRTLEKTVVDMYAELESKESELGLTTKNSRIHQQEIETKLCGSEEDNAKLKDLLRAAEERAKELEGRLRTGEQPADSVRDGAGRRETAGNGVAEAGTGAGWADGGRRPIAAIPGTTLSPEAVASGSAAPGDEDNQLGERYVVAVKRLQSLQRDLRRAEARQAELEDVNALLRRQLADSEANAEETSAELAVKVDRLTAQLDAAELNLQLLKVQQVLRTQNLLL